MKKKILVTLIAIAFGFSTIYAQNPYKHSFGITAGNMQALSYKTFGSKYFAFQVDLGTKYIVTNGSFKNFNLEGVNLWTLELNPNIMFEGRLFGNMYGLVGLGASIGYSWSMFQYRGFLGAWNIRKDFGKCGANGIFGLEYKLSAPIALQIDFRPGYGCLFAENYDAHYFDWSVNLGIRYAF